MIWNFLLQSAKCTGQVMFRHVSRSRHLVIAARAVWPELLTTSPLDKGAFQLHNYKTTDTLHAKWFEQLQTKTLLLSEFGFNFALNGWMTGEFQQSNPHISLSCGATLATMSFDFDPTSPQQQLDPNPVACLQRKWHFSTFSTFSTSLSTCWTSEIPAAWVHTVWFPWRLFEKHRNLTVQYHSVTSELPSQGHQWHGLAVVELDSVDDTWNKTAKNCKQ